jgi:hypothetical protein
MASTQESDEIPGRRKKNRKSKSQTKRSNTRQKEKRKAAGQSRSRNYTPEQHAQILYSRAATLPMEARRLIYKKYGFFPSTTLHLCLDPILNILLDIIPFDLSPVDVFSVIGPGAKAINQRLRRYPMIRRATITPLGDELLFPVIYREQNVSDYIFNQILVAHFPGYLKSETVQRTLAAWRLLRLARERGKHMPTEKHDTRSKSRKFKPIHLGIWRKKANALGLTGDTRAAKPGSLVRWATDQFLKEVEMIAQELYPMIAALCPNLVAKQEK